MTRYRIIVLKGKVRWYWLLESKNGETLAPGQKYYSKSNAVREARKLAEAFEIDLIITR